MNVRYPGKLYTFTSRKWHIIIYFLYYCRLKNNIYKNLIVFQALFKTLFKYQLIKPHKNTISFTSYYLLKIFKNQGVLLKVTQSMAELEIEPWKSGRSIWAGIIKLLRQPASHVVKIIISLPSDATVQSCPLPGWPSLCDQCNRRRGHYNIETSSLFESLALVIASFHDEMTLN